MGFFDQSNTRLEEVWFSVLAALSLICFPFGIRLARRFPQIVAAKLVPVLCLLLAYENIVLALSDVLSDDSAVIKVVRTTRAAVIPMFLVVMFEVAYAVHKRRSVKFCGIVFDQGHRTSIEPCSWFLRNFVRILAVVLFVLGILVNYDNIVGNDEKAGGTGLVDTEDASTHLLLALLPTTGMTVVALYIALYMWKYGNDASIVVQSTVCNGWIFLFLGSVALLAGQVPPESIFRVANESGQVLLLLSLIAIGREIGKEIQAADDFSSFLEKENELEGQQDGSNSVFSTVSTAVEEKKQPNGASSGMRPAVPGDRPAGDVNLPGETGREVDGRLRRRRNSWENDGGDYGADHDGRRHAFDVERGGAGGATVGAGIGSADDREVHDTFDDVLSTRRPSRTNMVGFPGLLHGSNHKGPNRGTSLLANRDAIDVSFAEFKSPEREAEDEIPPFPFGEGARSGEGEHSAGDGRGGGDVDGGARRPTDPYRPDAIVGSSSDFGDSDSGALRVAAADERSDVGLRMSRGADVV